MDRIAAASVEAQGPAANPYLQALSLPPGLSDTRQGAQGPTIVPPTTPPTRPSPGDEAPPRIAPKAPSAFSPPPSPRDEQKYFPQLKRF